MDQKRKDTIVNLIIFIFCVMGAIFLLSTADSFYFMGLGILFAAFGVVRLVNVIRLLTTNEQSQAEIEEKLVDIPKLETPCQVSIERSSSMLGAAMAVVVFLYDYEVGRLKNGKTLTFSTEYATNELKLVYQADGNIITGTFTAVAGGSVHFVLNYGQGELEQI